MSKELELLREEYQNKKEELEENNRLLQVLLHNNLVQIYRDTCIKNEALKKELEILEITLTSDKEKSATFDAIAIPNSRAFVVIPDKAQTFKNAKPNPRITKRNQEMAQRFRINNLTQVGDLKKKIRKP